MQCGGVSVSVLQRAPLSSLLEAVHQSVHPSVWFVLQYYSQHIYYSSSQLLLEISSKTHGYHIYTNSSKVPLIFQYQSPSATYVDLDTFTLKRSE